MIMVVIVASGSPSMFMMASPTIEATSRVIVLHFLELERKQRE